jgi:hypothetical protein
VHRLAGTDRTGQDHVLRAADELAAGKFEDLRPRDALERRPFDLVERLAGLTQQAARSALAAARFGVHPHEINAWSKAPMNAAPKVFADPREQTEEVSERKLAELYEQVSRLVVERSFVLRRSQL